MQLNNNKNVLILTGIGFETEQLVSQAFDIDVENLSVLNSFGPEIVQPYGDLMRDIVTAVYLKDIAEVLIIGKHLKDEEKKGNVFEKVLQRGESAKHIQTLDYLFKYCLTDGTSGNISEWLEGSKTVAEGIQKSIAIIRNHPFLPKDLKVQGFLINEEGNLTEILAREKSKEYSI